MAKKKRKNANKKCDDRVSTAMPRADFTKHLNEGFEDPVHYNQKGTIEDVARMVAADWGEEAPLLSSAPPGIKEAPPYGIITLVMGVLLSIYFLSAILNPEAATTFV